MIRAFKEKKNDWWFWVNFFRFASERSGSQAIDTDFQTSLITDNITRIIPDLWRYTFNDSADNLGLPEIDENKSIYIVDLTQGNGGVQWVTSNAAVNPITKKDIDDGVYVGLDMELPAYQGDFKPNPYGDLIKEYWGPTRTLVSDTLK